MFKDTFTILSVFDTDTQPIHGSKIGHPKISELYLF